MIKPMKLYAKKISTYKNIIGLKVGKTPFISMPYGGYTSLSYNINQANEEPAENNIYNNTYKEIQVLNNYKELNINNNLIKNNLNKINNDIKNYKSIEKKIEQKKKIEKVNYLNENNSKSTQIDLFEHIILSLKMANIFTERINKENINLQKRNLMNLSSERNTQVIKSIFEGSINNYIDYTSEKISKYEEENSKNFFSQLLIENRSTLSALEKNYRFTDNSKEMSGESNLLIENADSLVSTSVYESSERQELKKYARYINSKFILQKYLAYELLGSKSSFKSDKLTLQLSLSEKIIDNSDYTTRERIYKLLGKHFKGDYGKLIYVKDENTSSLINQESKLINLESEKEVSILIDNLFNNVSKLEEIINDANIIRQENEEYIDINQLTHNDMQIIISKLEAYDDSYKNYNFEDLIESSLALKEIISISNEKSISNSLSLVNDQKLINIFEKEISIEKYKKSIDRLIDELNSGIYDSELEKWFISSVSNNISLKELMEKKNLIDRPNKSSHFSDHEILLNDKGSDFRNQSLYQEKTLTNYVNNVEASRELKEIIIKEIIDRSLRRLTNQRDFLEKSWLDRILLDNNIFSKFDLVNRTILVNSLTTLKTKSDRASEIFINSVASNILDKGNHESVFIRNEIDKKSVKYNYHYDYSWLTYRSKDSAYENLNSFDYKNFLYKHNLIIDDIENRIIDQFANEKNNYYKKEMHIFKKEYKLFAERIINNTEHNNTSLESLSHKETIIKNLSNERTIDNKKDRQERFFTRNKYRVKNEQLIKLSNMRLEYSKKLNISDLIINREESYSNLISNLIKHTSSSDDETFLNLISKEIKKDLIKNITNLNYQVRSDALLRNSDELNDSFIKRITYALEKRMQSSILNNLLIDNTNFTSSHNLNNTNYKTSRHINLTSTQTSVFNKYKDKDINIIKILDSNQEKNTSNKIINLMDKDISLNTSFINSILLNDHLQDENMDSKQALSNFRDSLESRSFMATSKSLIYFNLSNDIVSRNAHDFSNVSNSPLDQFWSNLLNKNYTSILNLIKKSDTKVYDNLDVFREYKLDQNQNQLNKISSDKIVSQSIYSKFIKSIKEMNLQKKDEKRILNNINFNNVLSILSNNEDHNISSILSTAKTHNISSNNILDSIEETLTNNYLSRSALSDEIIKKNYKSVFKHSNLMNYASLNYILNSSSDNETLNSDTLIKHDFLKRYLKTITKHNSTSSFNERYKLLDLVTNQKVSSSNVFTNLKKSLKSSSNISTILRNKLTKNVFINNVEALDAYKINYQNSYKTLIAHIEKSENTSTINQNMHMDYKTNNINDDFIKIEEFEKVSKELIILKEKIKDMEVKNKSKKKIPKSKTRIFDSLSDKERLERQRRGEF